ITLRDKGLLACARSAARRGRGVVALLSSDSYNFHYRLDSPYGKHLFPDTMLATINGQAKTRHFLCEKRYRIEGVYDNLP
ncbi:MAG TPA: hypothetical protein VI542_12670, partial [Candidatus Tectomicrobia bacterium]